MKHIFAIVMFTLFLLQGCVASESTPTSSAIPYLGTKNAPPLQLFELISNNGNCKLPCWWGIEPGETTWVETKELINKLEGGTSDDKRDGYVRHEFNIPDPELVERHINGVFDEREGIVSSAIIRIYTGGNVDRGSFHDLWENLSPDNLLLDYGGPSRIWVSSSSSPPEPSDTIGYYVWFFYDDQDFLIRYLGVIPFEDLYRICPSFGSEGNLGGNTNAINIFLSSPMDTRTLEGMTDLEFLMPETILTIEEVSGYTAADYFSKFLETGNVPCFETPRNAWP